MEVSTRDSRANQRKRTRRALLDAASDLVRRGRVPSVAEVAESAAVSRATAYRYFPTQSSILEALIEEIRTTVPDYASVLPDPNDPVARVDAFLEAVVPHMESVEPQLRAALRLSLEQWGKTLAGDTKAERPIARGRRIALIEGALAPLKGRLDKATYRRLTMVLSILFGVEALVVLKDIWGLNGSEAKEIMRWAFRILIQSVMEGTRKERASTERQAEGKALPLR